MALRPRFGQTDGGIAQNIRQKPGLPQEENTSVIASMQKTGS